MRVKIITARTAECLEEKVNSYLSGVNAFFVKDIKLAITKNVEYTAMIIMQSPM